MPRVAVSIGWQIVVVGGKGVAALKRLSLDWHCQAICRNLFEQSLKGTCEDPRMIWEYLMPIYTCEDQYILHHLLHLNKSELMSVLILRPTGNMWSILQIHRCPKSPLVGGFLYRSVTNPGNNRYVMMPMVGPSHQPLHLSPLILAGETLGPGLYLKNENLSGPTCHGFTRWCP